MEMIYFLLKGGFEEHHGTPLDPSLGIDIFDSKHFGNRHFGTVDILGVDISAPTHREIFFFLIVRQQSDLTKKEILTIW